MEFPPVSLYILSCFFYYSVPHFFPQHIIISQPIKSIWSLAQIKAKLARLGPKVWGFPPTNYTTQAHSNIESKEHIDNFEVHTNTHTLTHTHKHTSSAHLQYVLTVHTNPSVQTAGWLRSVLGVMCQWAELTLSVERVYAIIGFNTLWLNPGWVRGMCVGVYVFER